MSAVVLTCNLRKSAALNTIPQDNNLYVRTTIQERRKFSTLCHSPDGINPRKQQSITVAAAEAAVRYLCNNCEKTFEKSNGLKEH